MPTMKLGILEDYGFWNYSHPQTTIDMYKKYVGIDYWKLAINWYVLEPTKNSFNSTYINGIKAFLNGANTNGAKVQITIRQQSFPGWTKGESEHYAEHGERYTNSTINNHLKDTWIHIVNEIKSYPALDSYLIVNEEVYIESSNVDAYNLANDVIINAIRTNDSNTNHKIHVRAAIHFKTSSSIIRNKVAQNGNQSLDYGYGGYPTTWSWEWNHYASPKSDTSFLNMTWCVRDSPLIHKLNSEDKDGAVGEIGFFKGSSDSFGDAEKLIAFKRAMAMAYENGMTEFMLWGTGSAFADPVTYFPQLKAFRDLLVTKPRLSRYNIRVVIDNGRRLLGDDTFTSSNPELNMANQPYYNLVKTLDEMGVSWFYTHNDAVGNEPNIHDATILTSEIANRSITEQNTLINSRLSGLTLTGNYYPWSTGEVTFRTGTSEQPVPAPTDNTGLIIGGTIFLGIIALVWFMSKQPTSNSSQPIEIGEY